MGRIARMDPKPPLSCGYVSTVQAIPTNLYFKIVFQSFYDNNVAVPSGFESPKTVLQNTI